MPMEKNIFTTVPSYFSENKCGQLNDNQIHQYFDQGFVILENFFSPEELEPVKNSIIEKVDELAKKLYNAGKINNIFSDYGFSERLIKLNEQFPHANVLLHKQGKLSQAFRDLWSNERLLNIVEQLIGPNIMGHPIWNLRTKTPYNEASTVPWHQDNAYLDDTVNEVLIPTVWIPLVDVNKENGCLQFIKGGHRTGKLATHKCCEGATWYVMLENEEMEKTLGVNMEKDVVTIPLGYGGMILFNNLIPHRSLDNLSKEVRWSLDLRWEAVGNPAGFYGIKDGVVMRLENQPDYKIDWESFDNVDRIAKAIEVVQEKKLTKEDEFNHIINGPWMHRWEIVHHNDHTNAMVRSSQKPVDSF